MSGRSLAALTVAVILIAGGLFALAARFDHGHSQRGRVTCFWNGKFETCVPSAP